LHKNRAQRDFQVCGQTITLNQEQGPTDMITDKVRSQYFKRLFTGVNTEVEKQLSKIFLVDLFGYDRFGAYFSSNKQSGFIVGSMITFYSLEESIHDAITGRSSYSETTFK
jgi:hypothetical protein